MLLDTSHIVICIIFAWN